MIPVCGKGVENIFKLIEGGTNVAVITAEVKDKEERVERNIENKVMPGSGTSIHGANAESIR